MPHLKNVDVVKKSNVYFEGKCVSHTVFMPSGEKKTVGVILPSVLTFRTGAPERMEIVAGTCTVVLDGAKATQDYSAGEVFDVPGKSGFTVTVHGGLCEYICSFLS